jgi:hypothetical protein
VVYFLWRQQSLPGNQSEKPRGLGQSPSGILAAHYRKKNGNPTSFMPLPRKQTMNGNEVSSTWVMISLTHFKAERKGDLIVIISQEIIPCPYCEGDLFVRGTCRRQAINSTGLKDHYRLRVLQCRNCRKTHRELPFPLVPYKRYDGEAITYIENAPSDAPCCIRSVTLILGWLDWFISYANHVSESLSLMLSVPLPKTSGIVQLSDFMSLVRIVVNSGNWSHNRTEFSCA